MPLSSELTRQKFFFMVTIIFGSDISLRHELLLFLLCDELLILKIVLGALFFKVLGCEDTVEDKVKYKEQGYCNVRGP